MPLSRISVTLPTDDRLFRGPGVTLIWTPSRHETSPHWGAQKVGVIGRFTLSVLTELEPPNVVAQIQPRYESRFAQLHQIAVDRGAVEVERLKGSRNFGVTGHARRGSGIGFAGFCSQERAAYR